MARSKMPRRSISFSEPQDAWLVAEARRLGISISEVNRHAIDVQRGARPVGSTPTRSNPSDPEPGSVDKAEASA